MITSIFLTSTIKTEQAYKISNLASKFASEVFIIFTNKKINAKSVLGLMSIQAKPGEEIHLYTSGEDEELAASEIKALLSQD